MERIEVGQSSNEGSDTVAFPILRLPLEILLVVLYHIPDWSSAVNLAHAHPKFRAIYREYQHSFRKVMMNNFLADVAKRALGYESSYLMKICLMKGQIQYSDTNKSDKDLSTILSNSWIASDEDLSLVHRLVNKLQYFQILVGELEFLGYFAQASNPNRWCERRFRPVARWQCNRRDRKLGAFTYRTQPRFENIELLAIIELWCIMRIKYGCAAMSLLTFWDMFTPEIAEKTKQFARRHIEVFKLTVAWHFLSDRYGFLAFIFCKEAVSAMTELASFSENEYRIHKGGLERTFDLDVLFLYERTPPSYHLTGNIE
ncbi:hypothetical protein FHL15_009529 [Xylaria flabelliformis]|uniref:F-box domain-containing protein n=1 Tax=Xylaria flabelliformis TaxID=2512241 RepID=A0A553HNW3_9PEZI|nr:hypothetical protein FHL15_009529 [Xylaria flabelliformis]